MSSLRCRLKHPGFVRALRSDQLGETDPLDDGTIYHPSLLRRCVRERRPRLLMNCNTQQLRYLLLMALHIPSKFAEAVTLFTYDD